MDHSSNAGVITSATATTLASWPTQWGSDILTPVEEADFIWVGDPNARVVNHDMFETTRAAIGHASDGLGTKKRGMPQTRADTWRAERLEVWGLEG